MPHKPKKTPKKKGMLDMPEQEKFIGPSSFGLIPPEFDDQPGTLDYCTSQIQKRGII